MGTEIKRAAVVRAMRKDPEGTLERLEGLLTAEQKAGLVGALVPEAAPAHEVVVLERVIGELEGLGKGGAQGYRSILIALHGKLDAARAAVKVVVAGPVEGGGGIVRG